MATIQTTYYSNALNHPVTLMAVIPADARDVYEPKKGPFRTLYLLHGLLGGYENYLYNSRIVQMAAKYNFAVIMPAGLNGFYVDNNAACAHYGEFVGEELVKMTRALFPLSEKREDTFIGGLSMGGYGAIRNGLKYSETFGAICGMSSALITEGMIHSTNDAVWPFGRRDYYEYTFGALDKVKGSDMDPKALVTTLKKQGREIPRMFLCCGTEDGLITPNRDFRDFLKAEGVKAEYREGPGIHDWVFWDNYLEQILEWL